MTDPLQPVQIKADQVPTALRQMATKANLDQGDKVLAEVAAQVIEQLLRTIGQERRDFESYAKSFGGVGKGKIG